MLPFRLFFFIIMYKTKMVIMHCIVLFTELEHDKDYIFSKRMAIPCPPPMQAEPMPYFWPSRLSLWTM